MTDIPSTKPGPLPLRTAVLTALAMVAFAGNSLLGRLALGGELIDPASYTAVRVIAGAVTLGLVVMARRQRLPRRAYASWRSIAALFAYMVFFSFAYALVPAGTGALILFGAVQLTMFITALREGETFSLMSWAGFALAVLGLVYLVLPGVGAPDPLGAVFIIVAGTAWGFFSLLARGVDHPVEANASNFVFCVPLVLLVGLCLPGEVTGTAAGFGLAVASGAITSGGGYVVWYTALRGLTATQAAVVQLCAPVIAAFGGVVFLSEALTLRLLLASVAILGGVAVVLLRRQATAPHS